jgi:2-polyprenyl-6-methoxyphenol hydroxylase-like FAD-dependent oxidoreductase
VRALPNVLVRDGVDMLGLTAAADRRGVSGVRLLGRQDGAAAESLAADLVVDATGRSGRAAGWWTEHGWPPPVEDAVQIDLRYATVRLTARPGDLDGRLVAISGATPAVPRGGAAIRQEDGSWLVSLFGYAGQAPPVDEDGFRAYAGTLVSPDFATLLAGRTLLDRPHAFRFPACRRRRFERLTEPPAGFVAVGDAICSVDPAFGQGMSVAALAAVALGEEYGRDRPDPARYHRRAAAIADRAWDVVVGADLQLPGVRGDRPAGHGAIAAYVRRVQRAARHDAVVAAAFMRVVNLLAPPSSLLTPPIAGRVLRPRRSAPAAGSLAA